MRIIQKKKIEDLPRLKNALLQWAQQFQEIAWLDSNNYKQSYSRFDAVLAVDAFTAIKTDATGGFDALQEYQQVTRDWIFGYLSYEMKNDVEALFSDNFDGLDFPDLYFFQPKKLFLLREGHLELHYLKMVDDELETDLQEIQELLSGGTTEKDSPVKPLRINPRISKAEYHQRVREIQGHIGRGDIYEANFCQEFFAEKAVINPLATYNRLNDLSRPPFACFVRLYDHFLLSASPERYLQKNGEELISQPIKGTAPRGIDEAEDRAFALGLAKDPKELSENLMIVDLVRNDLSKIAKKSSVEVSELCQIYTFPQVHQMISTVKAQLEEGVPAVEAMRSTFPIGSMTGAPKISAMEIIEKMEQTKRGLYSGAVGYFTPGEDFDFNVVIRSILYNRKKRYLSFSVGGAITAKSDPEKEYKECMVKARALQETLGSDTAGADTAN